MQCSIVLYQSLDMLWIYSCTQLRFCTLFTRVSIMCHAGTEMHMRMHSIGWSEGEKDRSTIIHKEMKIAELISSFKQMVRKTDIVLHHSCVSERSLTKVITAQRMGSKLKTNCPQPHTFWAVIKLQTKPSSLLHDNTIKTTHLRTIILIQKLQYCAISYIALILSGVSNKPEDV